MGQKGITLIELIVVMAIAGVIGWLVVSSFINLNDTLFDQEKTVDLQSSGREAIDKMVRVLREAGLNPWENDDFNGIEKATAKELRLVLGNIEDNSTEQVTFVFEENTFRYLDADNADLGEPDEDLDQLKKIKAIEVRLEMSDEKAKQRGDINRVFTTTIRGRNL